MKDDIRTFNEVKPTPEIISVGSWLEIGEFSPPKFEEVVKTTQKYFILESGNKIDRENMKRFIKRKRVPLAWFGAKPVTQDAINIFKAEATA